MLLNKSSKSYEDKEFILFKPFNLLITSKLFFTIKFCFTLTKSKISLNIVKSLLFASTKYEPKPQVIDLKETGFL